jgi:parvulin-like peptidyl-prolyl isomerase
MRIVVLLLAIAAVGVGGASWVFAAEAAGGAQAEQALPPPRVLGEVPALEQLRALSGVEVVVVNGDRISMDDVRARGLLYHGPYIAQDMVEEMLLEQEARRRGVAVSEEEIEAGMKLLRERWDIRSEAALESFLRVYRVTRDWLRLKGRYYMLVERLLGEQVHVSEREIEQYYLPRQEGYRRAEGVGLRIISFPAEEAAKGALEQLRQGRSFEEIAKEMARTPAERAIAGEVLFHERGQQPAWPADFEAAVFSAPLNQAVIVPAQNAYHLIRVEKKLDPHQFTLDEVREVIRQQLHQQKLESVVLPNWIRMQLANAKIEVMKAQ